MEIGCRHCGTVIAVVLSDAREEPEWGEHEHPGECIAALTTRINFLGRIIERLSPGSLPGWWPHEADDGIPVPTH